jgi:peroxiredoxin
MGWQLLRQNGRMLIRIEGLEKRVEEKAETRKQNAEIGQDGETESGEQKAEIDQSFVASAPASNGDERAERFSSRSLTNSKIKRDGLKPGTVAPEFRLARVDGGELGLSQLRGRLVLLVFSSPHCGPCNTLAPKLQKFHCKHRELELAMVSRESVEENRAKVKEHGLTFPVVLQKQWEVSRDYAYFATPVAYLIDGAGVIAADVAVGVDAVVDLMTQAKRMLRQEARARKPSLLQRLAPI